MDHAALIEALGGPAFVAAALGCDRTRAVRWRTDGIPPARFPGIIELARLKKIPGVTIASLKAGREQSPEAAA
jgi:hypothetical protein